MIGRRPVVGCVLCSHRRMRFFHIAHQHDDNAHTIYNRHNYYYYYYYCYYWLLLLLLGVGRVKVNTKQDAGGGVLL
jgi:hypothetical protein